MSRWMSVWVMAVVVMVAVMLPGVSTLAQDAVIPLPDSAFVAQTFMVAGKSMVCSENEPAGWFAPDEDLNVCFSVAQIDAPVELEAQWWSPNGEVALVESATFDSSMTNELYLTGIVNSGVPWDEGWWQVHFLIDGELAQIQWVPVIKQ